MGQMRQAGSGAERADSPYFNGRSELLAKPQYHLDDDALERRVGVLLQVFLDLCPAHGQELNTLGRAAVSDVGAVVIPVEDIVVEDELPSLRREARAVLADALGLVAGDEL